MKTELGEERTEERNKSEEMNWRRWRRRKCRGFTYLLKQITQVFFPASLLVCLLQSNLRRHTHTYTRTPCHTQSHKLTQALVYVLVCRVCSLRLAFFLTAAYFTPCLPSCFSFFICAMNISKITLMSLTLCVRHASCGFNPSHQPP